MKLFKKIGAYLLMIVFISSCSDDKGDIIIDTNSPEDFVISATSIDQYSAEISWTKSIDPQGDAVTYDLYFSDGDSEYTQLASSLTETKYSFTDLALNTNYYLYVEANDSDGNRNRQTFMFTTKDNEPPTDFTVTVNEVLDKTVSISWTTSSDPEGTSVVYDLYLNDELKVENLESLTYEITDLDYNTSYIVKIVAKDEDGYSTEVEADFITCSPDLSGTYNVLSSGTSTDANAVNNPLVDLAYTVTLTSNGDGTYNMSDGMAGVYIEWYSGYGYTIETPGNFTDSCGDLSGSWDSYFSGDTVDLTGKVNPDGTLNISWSNAFGDQVTAIYTKQ